MSKPNMQHKLPTHLYNVKIFRSYVEFLYEKHGWTENQVEDFFKECGKDVSFLDQDDNWFDQEFADHFHDTLSKKLGDPSIAYEAGKFSATATSKGIVGRFLQTFVTPKAGFRILPRFVQYYSRAFEMRIVQCTRSRAVVRCKVIDGCTEQEYQCLNRKGMLESFPTFFGCTHISLEETSCCHKGDECCEYVITWKNPAYLKITPVGFVCGALFFIAGIWFADLTHSILMGIIGFFLGRSITRKLSKSHFELVAEEQKSALEESLKILDQRSNESFLIQSILETTFPLCDEDKIVTTAAQLLHQRQVYDRILIMLVDYRRNVLVPKAWAGNGDSEVDELVRSTEFHLNPENKSGFFPHVINTKQPLLLRDISKKKDQLSKKTQQYVDMLQVEAFAAAPLILNDEAIGLISVENRLGSRPLFEKDLELLKRIAAVMVTTISNARNWKEASEALELARKLEEREHAINKQFARYVPAEVQGLLTPFQPSSLTVQKKELSVMFIDLCNFTQMSEEKRPEDVIRILNAYISEVSKVTSMFGGRINKIMGDGLLLYFDGQDKAVIDAGKEILQSIYYFNELLDPKDRLGLGIGAHKGECIIGNIGSQDRIDYSLFGVPVNVAARIQQYTRNLGPNVFCFSGSLLQGAEGHSFDFKGNLGLKGMKKRVPVYQLRAEFTNELMSA